jgi:hypothetical protein
LNTIPTHPCLKPSSCFKWLSSGFLCAESRASHFLALPISFTGGCAPASGAAAVVGGWFLVRLGCKSPALI